MLRVTNYVAKAGIREQIEMERLVSYLKHRNYKPIIRNMIMGMFNLGELNESEEDLTVRVIAHEDIEQVRYRFFPMMESGRIIGEIFFADDAVCVLNPFRENLLQASAIGYREHEKVLQEFCSNIENGIRDRFDGRRVRGMEFKWKEQGTLPSNIFFRRSRYSLVEEDTEEQAREFKFANPEYSSEDVAAANALVNSNARQFILNLARISKMRSKDAADFAEDQTLQSLFSLGLVSEEYLLTCRQDQHTICVAPSKDYLNACCELVFS